MKTPDRVVRKPELWNMIGVSDATIWRMEKAGKFPKRVQIGGNSVGWFLSEITRWLEQKASERS